MHYFAGQHLPADRMTGIAIYPNALQNGKCRFYVKKRVIRAAWGFRKLFLNVKHVDDTPIRREIRQYLGSRPTCYRYMNGQLTLTRTELTVTRMSRTVCQNNFKGWNPQFHPLKPTISSFETHGFSL